MWRLKQLPHKVTGADQGLEGEAEQVAAADCFYVAKNRTLTMLVLVVIVCTLGMGSH